MTNRIQSYDSSERGAVGLNIFVLPFFFYFFIIYKINYESKNPDLKAFDWLQISFCDCFAPELP